MSRHLARASIVQLLSGRWTLAVLTELADGGRYQDLYDALGGIAYKVLTETGIRHWPSGGLTVDVKRIPRMPSGARSVVPVADPVAVTISNRWIGLKGPKTPMHGRLQENRRDGGASDVRGGVVDPEEPFIRQAKFLPI